MFLKVFITSHSSQYIVSGLLVGSVSKLGNSGPAVRSGPHFGVTTSTWMGDRLGIAGAAGFLFFFFFFFFFFLFLICMNFMIFFFQ